MQNSVSSVSASIFLRNYENIMLSVTCIMSSEDSERVGKWGLLYEHELRSRLVSFPLKGMQRSALRFVPLRVL